MSAAGGAIPLSPPTGKPQGKEVNTKMAKLLIRVVFDKEGCVLEEYAEP